MPCSKRGQSGDLEYKKIIASPAGKVNRNSPTKNALGKFSSDRFSPPLRRFVTHRRRDISLGTRDRPGGAGVGSGFETGARPPQGTGLVGQASEAPLKQGTARRRGQARRGRCRKRL